MPQITSLTATPANVAFGGTTIVSWPATNATSATMLIQGIFLTNPFPAPVSGSYTFAPNVPTTYVLTVFGPNGSASRSVSVTVPSANPPQLSVLTPTGPLPPGTTSTILSVGSTEGSNVSV